MESDAKTIIHWLSHSLSSTPAEPHHKEPVATRLPVVHWAVCESPHQLKREAAPIAPYPPEVLEVVEGYRSLIARFLILRKSKLLIFDRESGEFLREYRKDLYDRATMVLKVRYLVYLVNQ